MPTRPRTHQRSALPCERNAPFTLTDDFAEDDIIAEDDIAEDDFAEEKEKERGFGIDTNALTEEQQEQ